MHLAAKYALEEAVLAGIGDDEGRVRILRTCRACGDRQWQEMPQRVRRVKIEHRLDSGRVADVALFGPEGEPACVVEIRRSHGVDRSKRDDLRGIPWMELAAGQVLKSPRSWFPLASGGLRPFRCSCRGARRLRTVRRRFGIHVPECPLAVGLPAGQVRRNVVADCLRCPFLRGIDRRAGKDRAATVVLCGAVARRTPDD